MTELEKRLAQQVDAVRQKMAGAMRAAGRPDGSVLLCAASKTQNAQTVCASAACAIDVFGENRVQELDVYKRQAVCRMAVRKLCESLRVPAGAKAQAKQIWKERKGV